MGVQEQGAKSLPGERLGRRIQRLLECLPAPEGLGRAASSRVLRGFWGGFRFTSVDGGLRSQESLREAMHTLGCGSCSSASRGSQILPANVRR